LVAVQDHDPVNRTHEGVIMIAPAHGFWNRQCLQGVADNFLHEGGGRFAALLRTMHKPRALVGLQLLQLSGSNTTRCRKTQQGLGRLTIRIECRVERRATSFDCLIRLRD